MSSISIKLSVLFLIAALILPFLLLPHNAHAQYGGGGGGGGGGSGGVEVINYDFGSLKSPLKINWIRVTPEDIYDVNNYSFGWKFEGAATSTDNGDIPEPDDMLQDFNKQLAPFTHNTFRARVSAYELYKIIIYFRDKVDRRFEYKVEDSATTTITVPANTTVVEVVHDVIAADGIMDISFSKIKSEDGEWIVNGVVIEKNIRTISGAITGPVGSAQSESPEATLRRVASTPSSILRSGGTTTLTIEMSNVSNAISILQREGRLATYRDLARQAVRQLLIALIEHAIELITNRLTALLKGQA